MEFRKINNFNHIIMKLNMKKIILIIIVFIQILASGISGCFEEEQVVEKSTLLSDGTKVTGHINDIEIIDYEIIREKKLYFENQWEDTSYEYTLNAIVPSDLNISDIETNFTKRKFICENYLDSVIPLKEYPVNWDEDYMGYTIPNVSHILIDNFELENKTHSLEIRGVAKNIGHSEILTVIIKVVFYNESGHRLSSQSQYHNNISKDKTWEFRIRHVGIRKDEINSISFNVSANYLMVY